MTPKEKAKELYNKMLQWQDNADIYIERKITSTNAKQSALIAVDEIQEMLILTRKRLDISDTTQLNINDNNIIYSILWFDEVKEEIEQL